VGHAGGQKTDGRQLFAADHLFGALANLLVAFLDLQIQVVADLQKPVRHGVHRAGQFGDFVVRLQLDAVLEVAVAGDATAALNQRAQGLEYRAAEKICQDYQDHTGRHAGDPGQCDPRVILATNLAGQIGQAPMQVLRQRQGE